MSIGHEWAGVGRRAALAHDAKHQGARRVKITLQGRAGAYGRRPRTQRTGAEARSRSSARSWCHRASALQRLHSYN